MPSAHPSFSVSAARQLVSDLFTPNPWIYWIDLLITLCVAYSAAIFFLVADSFSVWALACYVVAGFGLFRASLFMHEIVHFRKGEMVPFKIAWNVLAGIPMLTPSFLYESHLAHHNTRHYGTGNDGEYLPLGVGSFRNILRFLAQVFCLPLFVGLRFTIGTPISFLHPQLRQWTLERASSFVINFSYRRAIPENAPRRTWALVEWACWLRACSIFALPLMGWQPWTRVLQVYALALLALGLNHVRTLVAHRYLSNGEKMTFVEQLSDSVNVTGLPILTELVFPVGLRYHALHHLFPSLPYHNLGKAHRRLWENLPAGSAYHQATAPSFWSAVQDLMQNSNAAMADPPPGSELWYARRRDESTLVTPELDDEPAGRSPVEAKRPA